MNIFEGITKEKFIEEFNKERNGSLSSLHIKLVFDYKDLKIEKAKFKKYTFLKFLSISDVNNYEQEIEMFNSFKPFVEYEGKPVLIIDNYNKYLSYRDKSENKLHFFNKEAYLSQLNCLIFEDIVDFDKFVKSEKRKKTYEDIVKELDKSVEDFSNKILSKLNDRFIEYVDNGYKLEFTLKFTEIEQLKKDRKIFKKYLTNNNFFDNFRLTLKKVFSYDTFYNHENKPIPIDNYIYLIEEYLSIIKEVGEYFDYEIMVHNFYEFTFKK